MCICACTRVSVCVCVCDVHRRDVRVCMCVGGCVRMGVAGCVCACVDGMSRQRQMRWMDRQTAVPQRSRTLPLCGPLTCFGQPRVNGGHTSFRTHWEAPPATQLRRPRPRGSLWAAQPRKPLRFGEFCSPYSSPHLHAHYGKNLHLTSDLRPGGADRSPWSQTAEAEVALPPS